MTHDSDGDGDTPFDDFLPSRWRNDDDDDFLRNSKHHHSKVKKTITSSSVKVSKHHHHNSDRSMSTGETYVMDEDPTSSSGEDCGDTMRTSSSSTKRATSDKRSKKTSTASLLDKRSRPEQADRRKKEAAPRPASSRREALREPPSLGNHLGSSQGVAGDDLMVSSTHSGLASIAEEADDCDSKGSDDDDHLIARSGSPPIDERDRQFLETIQDDPLPAVPHQPRAARRSSSMPQERSILMNDVTSKKPERESKQSVKPAWARRLSLGIVSSADHRKPPNKGLLDSLLHNPPKDESNRAAKSPLHLSPADEMSVGSKESHGAHLRGDLRQSLLRMNSVMNRSATFSMTPEELQVREMRPWRKQSQLRSAKVSMQQAALAVQAEFDEEGDSESTVENPNQRDSYDDNKSMIDSVCYRIPDEFQRTPKPPKRENVDFDDVWGPGGLTEDDALVGVLTGSTESERQNVPQANPRRPEKAANEPSKTMLFTKYKKTSGASKQEEIPRLKQKKSRTRLEKKGPSSRSASSALTTESAQSGQASEEFEDLFKQIEAQKEQTRSRADDKVKESTGGDDGTHGKSKKKKKKKKRPEEERRQSKCPDHGERTGPKISATSRDEAKPKKYKRDEDPKLHNLVIDIDDSSETSSLSGHFGPGGANQHTLEAKNAKSLTKKRHENDLGDNAKKCSKKDRTTQSGSTTKESVPMTTLSDRSVPIAPQLTFPTESGGIVVPPPQSRLSFMTATAGRPWSPSDSHPRPLVNAKMKARDTPRKAGEVKVVRNEERSRDGSRKLKKDKSSNKKKKKEKSSKKKKEASSRPTLPTRSKSERFEFVPREPSFRREASFKLAPRSSISGQVPISLDVTSSPRSEWDGHRKLKVTMTGQGFSSLNSITGPVATGISGVNMEKHKAREKGGKSTSIRRGRAHEPGYEKGKERRRSSSVPKARKSSDDKRDAKEQRKHKGRERTRSSSVPRKERKANIAKPVADAEAVRVALGSGRSLWSESTSSGSQKSLKRNMFARRLRRRGSM